ncbi:MAG: hypothetical protein AB7U23_13170 [Dehalococcoidia bacterium]
MTDMLETYRARLRSSIITDGLGTPGAGLAGPEQFDAMLVLAKKQISFLNRMRLEPVGAKTGSLRRIAFGDDNLEAAAEASDTGNSFSPTHSGVPFSLTKARFMAKLSNDVNKFSVPGHNYEDVFNQEASEAFMRAVLRLCWLGDTASADPSLRINDGWRKQIIAGGNPVNASSATITHAMGYSAIKALDENHLENLADYSWQMSMLRWTQIREYTSGRSTGEGDKAITEGPNGEAKWLGLPVDIVGFTGTSGGDIVLSKPKELIAAVDSTDFRLKRVTGGHLDLQDAFALLGFLWVDPVIADVAGTSVIYNLG